MVLHVITMFIAAASTLHIAHSQTVVQLGGKVSTIAPEFVSFTTDIGIVSSSFKTLNTTDPKLAGLMHSLKPSIMRIGGTAADYATYLSASNPVGGYSGNQWTLTKQMIDVMCAYAQTSQWRVVFGLNAQPGYNTSASHSWNDTNAREILAYFASSHCPISGFELGNELNMGFRQAGKGIFTGQLQGSHVNSLANHTLPAFYASLGNGTTRSPWIIGPDTTQGGITPASTVDAVYLRDFLSSFGPDDYGVDRVTWHQYQEPGQTVGWYLEPIHMDLVMNQVIGVNKTFTNYSQARVASGRPAPELWIGETGIELDSEAEPNGPTGRHVPGLDSGFAGALAFADKLGLAMRFGHSVVVQQQFPHLVITDTDPVTGSQYLGGIVPSLFMSALWKQVAGTTVLSVGGDRKAGRTLRVYAVCAAAPAIGSAAVIVINVDAAAPVNISFASESTGDDLTPSAVYQLAPYPNARNVTEPTMSINGKPTAITTTGAIPQVIPAAIPTGIQSVTVDPRTMAIVIVDQVQACESN